MSSRVLSMILLASLATTARALPRDPYDPPPGSPPNRLPPTQGGPAGDPFGRGRGGGERAGFGAIEAGLTLVTDDAATNQRAVDLGFRVGAYLGRRIVVVGRGSVALDAADTPGRPTVRDLGVTFGVAGRAWRPVWLGAGLGFARHRFAEPGMSSSTPTAWVRMDVDVARSGATTMFATADWTVDLGLDSSTQLATLGLGVRYH